MKDILDSAIQGIKNRFIDPLPGTYTVFFILINWKSVIYLFSNEKVAYKISAIEDIIFHLYFEIPNWPTLSKIIFNSFSLSLLLTILYFLGQKILHPVYKFIENIKVQNANIHTEARKKLTSIEKQIEHTEHKYRDEFDKRSRAEELAQARETTINSLNENIKSLQEKISILEKDKSNIYVDENSLQSISLNPKSIEFHRPIEDYALENHMSSKDALEIYNEHIFDITKKMETLRPLSESFNAAKEFLYRYKNDHNLMALNQALRILGQQINNKKLGEETQLAIYDFQKTAERIINFHI